MRHGDVRVECTSSRRRGRVAFRRWIVASVAMVCGLALSLVSRDVSASCRTTTRPPPPDFAGPGCFTEGVPVYQPSTCLTYRLQDRESAKIPRRAVSDVLAQAFQAWEAPNAVCTPGFTAIELPAVKVDKIVDYRDGERDMNVVGVYDDVWPHDDADETLALTTLTFNAESGAILSADIEINATNVKWALTAPPKDDEFDLLGALMHQVGHFVGLAHSAEPKAVMFPHAEQGAADHRVLRDDDVAGVCAVYPDRATRVTAKGPVAAEACQLGPASSTCGAPKITHGCGVAPGAAGADGAAAAAFALGIAGVVSRRRRRG